MDRYMMLEKERKLIIPMKFALQAAQGSGLRFLDGRVVSNSKTESFMCSDEMIERLVMNVMNVLTVPHLHLCGTRSSIAHIQSVACQTLINIVQSLPRTDEEAVEDCDTFVRAAISDGLRFGEEYLGYKPRTDVIDNLKQIWALYKKPTDQRNHTVHGCHPQFQIPRAGSVILLNGFPGIGKYSIGRTFGKMFDSNRVRFIDNHLLIDPVQAITPGRDEDHKELCRAFREVAFEALCKIPDEDTTMILTACLGSTTEDQQILEEHIDVACYRRVPMYIINVTCALAEHHSRLLATERSAGTKTKLLNPEILDSMLSKHRLVQLPDILDNHARDYGQSVLQLDATGKSIEESATQMFAMVTQ